MSSIHRLEDSTVDQQLLESLRRSREQLNAYKRDSMADIEQMNRAINAAKQTLLLLALHSSFQPQI